MKKFGKIRLFEFSIPKSSYMEIFMKIWEKEFGPFFNTFLTNQGRNEDQDEKIGKNKSNVWTLHIKIRLHGKFHENLREKNWPIFLRHSWLIMVKIKMEEKKFGKMNSIFEFSMTKITWEGHTGTEVLKGLIFLKK